MDKKQGRENFGPASPHSLSGPKAGPLPSEDAGDWRKGSVFIAGALTLAALIVLALVYRLPASTDDFDWGVMLNQGKSLPLIDDYFFRLPVCKVLYYLTLPLLLSRPFWGKLLIWGTGIIGLLLPLSWFFRKFRFDPLLLPIISFLAFFAPNQYELDFNLSSMPFTYGLLFVGLGFLCFRKGWRAPGILLYLLAFLTLESFIVLAVLLEFSARVPLLTDRKVLKKIVLDLLPVLILFGVIRIGLHLIHPYHYGYGADFALRFSQGKGFIIKTFFIEFFKLNSVLSAIQLLLYGALAFFWLKSIGLDERRRWAGSLFVLFLVLMILSWYYYVLNYPAGRALIGQIAFVWGAYLLFVVGYLLRFGGRPAIKILLFGLFLSAQIANQALIWRTKKFNFFQINKEVALVRDRLSKIEGSIDVDPAIVRTHFKRDWIFASNADVEMMLRYYLRPEEFSRLRMTE